MLLKKKKRQTIVRNFGRNSNNFDKQKVKNESVTK